MAIDLGSRASELGRAAQRLVVLQALTAALARTRTYVEIASVIIDEALPALKAEVGVVALVSEDGRMLRNVGFKGVDAATEDAWRDYPVESPVPVAEAARLRKAIIVRTVTERNARYPVLAEIHGLEHGGPVTTFPLIVDARLLGVLGLCWGSPLEIDGDDLVFLQTLADQCGLAIERARLYELAAREIAERKASEGKLREANERKDEFLAMLGHELRNPLASIRGAADVLGQALGAKQTSDRRLERVYDVLERQTSHMKRIVDDLLDVSRLASGRLTVELVTLDLGELVASTTSDHIPAFTSAGLTVDVAVPPEAVWVRADRTRLAQAIGNVLHNAMKFSHRGTRVGIVVERRSDAAVVEVSDEGIGIEADLLPRLFEPFAQADRTLARSSGGLGLGLSLVRGLVRLHGGEVAAESQGPGTGALFRLTLPVAPRGEEAARSPAGSLPRQSKRILVVEDNEDAAEMLGMLLDSFGHDVRLAHRASAALEILQAWLPDVILSDIGLPDMDGFAFASEVRRRSSADGTRPVLIAITGYGSQADRERAQRVGFDALITKPVDVATLETLIASEEAGGGTPAAGSRTTS